jgi:hypothetical protein
MGEHEVDIEGGLLSDRDGVDVLGVGGGLAGIRRGRRREGRERGTLRACCCRR